MKQNRARSFTYLNEETYLRQDFSFFGSLRVCSVRVLVYLAPRWLCQDCQENNPHGYARSVLSHAWCTQTSEKLEAGCTPGVCNSQLKYCQLNWSLPAEMRSMHPFLLIALYWWRLDHSTVILPEVHRIHQLWDFPLWLRKISHTGTWNSLLHRLAPLKITLSSQCAVAAEELSLVSPMVHTWYFSHLYKLSSFGPVMSHPKTKKAGILRISSLLS